MKAKKNVDTLAHDFSRALMHGILDGYIHLPGVAEEPERED